MCRLACALWLVIASGSVEMTFNIKPGLWKERSGTLLEICAVKIWIEICISGTLDTEEKVPAPSSLSFHKKLNKINKCA